MSELVTFLRARLDEDEAWAKWAADRSAAEWHPDFAPRHDPARVLREVAAKRRILDQLGTDLSYRPPVPPGHQRAWAIATLIVEAMASTYSDHPDYDQAWKR